MTLDQNIWLVFGLSATGKSYFGQHVAFQNNWAHFEIDQKRPGIVDGLDLYGFRNGWNEFMQTADPGVFLGEVRNKYMEEGKGGAVLTFQSDAFLTAEGIALLAPQAKAIYLVGRPELCLRYFLLREQKTGRNLPKSYWIHHNSFVLDLIKNPALKKYLVNVFSETGDRVPVTELIARVKAK